jgi:Putative metallopeptidase
MDFILNRNGVAEKETRVTPLGRVLAGLAVFSLVIASVAGCGSGPGSDPKAPVVGTDTAVDSTSVSPEVADSAIGAAIPEGLWNLDVSAEEFVEGNLYFIGYHEIAHAFVSEFNLPVVGREEDAADRLAILLMTPANDSDTPQHLNAAMQGWFVTASAQRLDEIPWWDEHGTDQQRGFQIACLLYGADPKRFVEAADAVALPDNRRETCVFEAEQNIAAWDALLTDPALKESETGSDDAVIVTYEPTTSFADQLETLKRNGLLEHLDEFMTTNYRFEPGITIQAQECGEPNAFWDPAKRTLRICYELVADLQDIA